LLSFFSYAYRDKRFEQEELMKYATLEYEKPKDQITNDEIEQIRAILDRKSSFYNQFELTRIQDETFRIGNYKKTLNAYINFEKNNKRQAKCLVCLFFLKHQNKFCPSKTW